MKIPDRIVGFLELNDEKLSFELNKETFRLKLYFSSCEEAEKHYFDGFSGFDEALKEHKWIEKIVLSGKTAEGYKVYFGTKDNPETYNGYPTYVVDWFYLSNADSGGISEISFSGREINCFFNPDRVFRQNIKFQKGNANHIESMNVEAMTCDDFACGEYIYDGKKISIFCSAYATMRFHTELPFDAKSYMRLIISGEIDVEELVNITFDILTFIKYVCYRNNVELSEILTYTNSDEGKTNCGILKFRTSDRTENNKKAKTKIIKAEYLGKHVSTILEAISNDEFSFGHLCKSIDDTSHYPVSRIIMILAAFEREFRNIYGQDVKRSEEYKKTKDEVMQLLEQYAENYTGKQRRYIKGFVKGIQNTDSSYGDNFCFSLNECKTIMKPFVVRRYEGTYEEIVSELGENINFLRNGLAHSRLDLNLEARHLSDIKIVEEMIYVMRFKKLGIEDEIIKKCINDLFDVGLGL